MRFHSLDSLRASLMALGIVFHSAITYTTFPAWPLRDSAASPFCDVLYCFIHSFRMPLFFLLAGFFANMLYRRMPLRSFVLHRAKRILAPFAAALLLLTLPVHAGMTYGRGGSTLWDSLASTMYLRHPGTFHLWFLYYLLYFYATAVLVGFPAKSLLPDSTRARLTRGFRTLAASPWRALVFALPTWAVFAFMRSGGLDTATSLIPKPAVLAACGLFFAFGWFLWTERDLLPTFRRHAWVHVAIALALLPLNVIATASTHDHTVAVLTTGLLAWLLIFGFLGLAHQYLNRPHRFIRYLSDAAYWMYLVHLPVVIWTQIALLHVPIPATAKFLIVTALTTAVALATYELLVRRTFLATILGGARLPQPRAPLVLHSA